MQPPESEAFTLSGRFLEIDAPTRLRYTFAWEEPLPMTGNSRRAVLRAVATHGAVLVTGRLRDRGTTRAASKRLDGCPREAAGTRSTTDLPTSTSTYTRDPGIGATTCGARCADTSTGPWGSAARTRWPGSCGHGAASGLRDRARSSRATAQHGRPSPLLPLSAGVRALGRLQTARPASAPGRTPSSRVTRPGYRALVIGTGLHVVATNQILRSIRRAALG